MRDMIAVILAAGRGTRMKSAAPKVLHEILGRSVIGYVLDAVKGAGVSETVTVVGYGSDELKKVLGGSKVAVQKKLLGSGDAVLTAKARLDGYSGDLLIICGDTPLVRSDTIKALIDKHKNSKASLTVLTAEMRNPTGYGRIRRDDNGRIVKIIEELEAGLYEEVIKEINVGTYCCKALELFGALAEVKPNKKKEEVFLTDAVAILHRKGKLIESVMTKDPDEAVGINTRKDLARATDIMKTGIMDELMDSGVTIEDPDSTTIYPGVKIGADTVIHPNTFIESGVRIGRSCHIGPFARLRPGTAIGDSVEVGNFVELNRTHVGDGAKIKHHAYLGDTTVGKNVNVGAGTITANYDGRNKNKTVIEDGAFVGVGAILIAPVRIGSKATVGAGCVVPKNHDVPKDAVVIGVPARIYRKRAGRDRRK
jgi:bifunctional UDP-N-acetylglucosamine pyrophosphorylase / glucosamine-1-phosphate N-acetyltransferase